MKKEKILQEVQEQISELQEEKEKYEKKLAQLRNREKQLKKMASLKERKKRNHRLIERGAILESFIEGANEKTNEEIKGILQKAFQKAD